MNIFHKLLGKFLVAIFGVAFSASTMATLLILNSLDAEWTSVSGGVSNLNGIGTNQVNWGTGTDEQAGLRFDPVSPPVSIETDTAFALGDLSHLNNPTFGNAATGANLVVDITVTNGSTEMGSFDLGFSILETTNSSPCGPEQVSDTPCDDIIGFPEPLSSEFFNIDGIDYKLLVLGFGASADMLQTEFITEEGRINTATLWGELDSTETPGGGIPVPEPTTFALLSLGLAGLGLTRRKVKA